MYSATYSTNDKSIRTVLIKTLKKSVCSYKGDSAIIPELSLSNTGTRADVTLVNGVLHGYELKGDLDNLTRLPRQIDGYNSIFDKITIVVGKKHLLHTVQTVPEWWGIVLAKAITSNRNPSLIELRKPSKNTLQDLKTVVDLLWKSEIVEILKNETSCKNLASFAKEELIVLLLNKLSVSSAKTYVRKYLVNRS